MNYAYGDKGQLGSSCMRTTDCQKYFGIYQKNPEVCQLLVYVNKDNNKDTRDFKYDTEVLEVISETEFVVKPWDDFELDKDLFIYGKEINDFLTIDKPLIGLLAAGACKTLSEKVNTLQATVDAQAAEIASLKATVAAILEKISI
jgi:hypothetical protein